MRIAQVAPLSESVPPRRYGGTERVVHYLTEGLVRLGHDVTLFASGDSTTSARLVPACDESLRRNAGEALDPLAPQTLLLELLAQRVEAGEFDVVHLHTDHVAWPILSRTAVPFVTTLHGRLDLKGLPPLVSAFPEVPLISISNAQRWPLPGAGWLRTIYHGLPEEMYRPGDGKGGYLAFLGRISPEKRVDRAIAIASRANIPLRIAAKVDPADEEYFERVIAPLLENPLVGYLGEIDDTEKEAFLGDAAALLFPIDWPEPFGLVMIEAFACGTPVVAFRRGSVPEVVRHGVTGFIVDDIDEAVRAVDSLHLISRTDCRAEFEERFTARRMVDDYVAVYQSLIAAAEGSDIEPAPMPVAS